MKLQLYWAVCQKATSAIEKIESGNTDWEIWLEFRGRMHIKPGGYGWPN